MPRRILNGTVVSTACDKTVVVEVQRRVMHPLYRKTITRSSKFMAHDPNNSCAVGDEVTIRECPPISKRKTWELVSGADSGK